MMEKVFLVFLSVVYLAGFISRNMIVRKRTGAVVKAKGGPADITILLSFLIFGVALASVLDDRAFRLFLPLADTSNSMVEAVGILLMAAAILFGWISSGQLRDSWRVGIVDGQDTPLVESGVFSRIRNPYFLSIYAICFSLFMIRPSLLLLLTITAGIGAFHRLVLQEEAFLAERHGRRYAEYRKRAGRYLPGPGRR